MRHFIKWLWLGWQSRNYWLITIFIWLLISFFGIYQANLLGSQNYSDIFFLSLGGPPVNNFHFLSFSAWFLPQLYLVYWLGNKAHTELCGHAFFTMLRVKSRSKWYINIMIISLIITLLYCVTGVLTVLLISFFNSASASPSILWQEATWDTPITLSSFQLSFWLIFLLFSSLITLVVFQTYLSLRLKNSSVSFVIVTSYLILSWIISSFWPVSTPFLIGAQSLWFRHTLFTQTVPSWYSFSWSLIYNSLLTLFILILGYFYIKQADIDIEKDTL